MVVPVHGYVASAQSFLTACDWDRAVDACAEVESRPFRGISETQIRISHAIRGGGARLRGGRLDEEIRNAHVHGKVFAKAVADCRVYVSDEPIGVAAAFIGFCPCDTLLLAAAFTGPQWYGLGLGRQREKEWKNKNQQEPLNV